MSDKLKTIICGVEFKNPIIAASGTFGYGMEFARFTDLNSIGGISVKGISIEETEGNPMPRIAETHAGMLNSIGLQNIGADKFIKEKLPFLRKFDTKVIVNFWGKSTEQYIAAAERLDDADIDMLEMNISCPNIKEGGISFSSDPKKAYDVVHAVRKVVKNKPLIVKLSPNVTDIRPYAVAVEEAGADAVSAINTLLGMAINIHNMKPKLGNIVGGLSGPAIKPVALRMVYEIAKTINIPVIGMGGISSWEDAAEFFIVGASAVQVGTANFVDPDICRKIAIGLGKYLEQKCLTIDELKARMVIS